MILLDTVVLSELRKARPSPRVLAWVRRQPERELFVSVVSLGEIERGVRRAPDAAFTEVLARWLEDLIRFHGERILDVTTDIARRWGRLSAALGDADGADLLIAATAQSHRLTVATRNVRDFVPTGVPVVDPFEA